MALVNFTNLDFNDIKSSIKDYLRLNSNFTDYDFEGSNLSIILDILAYNTYISSYNANMISNEIFIDSATLRENVVSLAKNIGYIPKSRISPRSKISFFVDTTELSFNPVTLTLKRGIVCSTPTSFGRESYTFSILNDITVPVVNKIAFFSDVEIYEGTYLTSNFTVDSLNPNQKFILNNANIDSSLISVQVRDNQNSSSSTKYNLSDSLFDIGPESKVFFIQEIEDQRYELVFGDGIFGKKLSANNYIEVSYIVTNGPSANGLSNFTFAGRIIDNEGNTITSDISDLTTDQSAAGGKDIESINSIKKYAPRIYAAQNRAVTAADYEAIVPQIYPEAESVSAFGGENLDPPEYGKVFITIKPTNGAFVPNSIKDNIISSLRKYSVAGIVPEILDLKYLYVEFDSRIYYNTNFSSSPSNISTGVLNNINEYANSSELNKYGAKFKYSKFLKIIDNSDQSITSNITRIQIRRDLSPTLNSLAEYEICFGNQFYVEGGNGYNIKSSGFEIAGITGTVYLADIPDSGTDGRYGSLFFFRLDSDTQSSTIKKSVGKIDYLKGEIFLNPVNIVGTSKNFEGRPIIEISAIPLSNDVIGLKDLYLQLDVNNSFITTLKDEIASGSDISDLNLPYKNTSYTGTTYIVTSSYDTGNLVRL